MRAVLDCIAHQIRKNRKTCIDRRVKTLFLHADDFFDVVLFLGKLRISAAVVLNHHIAKLRKEGMVNAEKLAVTGSTADDAAKHIAAAFVGRNNAVADHKRRTADMVGDNANGNIVLGVFAVSLVRDLADRVENTANGIDLKHVVHALHDARKTLKTHAGIDVLLDKLGIIALAVVVELREDVVPDLHVAVAVAAGLAVRFAAAVFFAAVEIDFRAGTAGTRTVLPEVVLFAETDDMRFGNTDFVFPNIVGFVVLFIDRRPKQILRHFKRFGQKLPCPGDSLFLEIIAEGEVAEHFEIRAVTRGHTDAFKVGRADTLLAGRDAVARRLDLAGEVFFHGRHAGIDEKKTFVVVGNERKAGKPQMSLAFKKGKIFFP